MKTTKKAPKMQSSDVFCVKAGKVILLKPDTAMAIYKDRVNEKMSFNGLEEKYNLQRQNGMVSYRIFNAVKKFLKQQKKK